MGVGTSPVVLDPQYNVERSQHALIIQHLQTKVQDTACSEENKPTPESRQRTQHSEEEVRVRPFNSGYILKEMRRKQMQSKTLKRYQTPSLGLHPSAHSEQLRPLPSRPGRSGRRMVEIKSARLIATLREIQ